VVTILGSKGLSPPAGERPPAGFSVRRHLHRRVEYRASLCEAP
jgi:hypothetical protein